VTPDPLREGVRQGILDALGEERASSGKPLVRRLAASGAAGVAAAVGLLFLFAGDSERGLRLAICGALWSALLVECFAFALLRVRTRRIELGQAATLGLSGLVLAAGFAFACPDKHLGRWWVSTALGAQAQALGGELIALLCFGTGSAAILGLVATLLVVWRGARLTGALAPAVTLSLLLGPAILLQGAGVSALVPAAWAVGILLGAYLGVRSAAVLIRVAHAGG
jgi:hypothetical protein